MADLSIQAREQPEHQDAPRAPHHPAAPDSFSDASRRVYERLVKVYEKDAHTWRPRELASWFGLMLSIYRAPSWISKHHAYREIMAGEKKPTWPVVVFFKEYYKDGDRFMKSKNFRLALAADFPGADFNNPDNRWHDWYLQLPDATPFNNRVVADNGPGQSVPPIQDEEPALRLSPRAVPVSQEASTRGNEVIQDHSPQEERERRRPFIKREHVESDEEEYGYLPERTPKRSPKRSRHAEEPEAHPSLRKDKKALTPTRAKKMAEFEKLKDEVDKECQKSINEAYDVRHRTLCMFTEDQISQGVGKSSKAIMEDLVNELSD